MTPQGFDEVREGCRGLLKQLPPACVMGEASGASLERVAQPGRGVAERAQKRHRIFPEDVRERREQQSSDSDPGVCGAAVAQVRDRPVGSRVRL